MPDLGKVYLVGAGPGAADLITLRAIRILRSADVILHDSLIDLELLNEVRSDAMILAVGKRGYCVGSTRQESIHEAMVRLAYEGKTVCRLKCGDPCIFGRGGEEAEALAEAGVEFEFVPGVTSALGAAASSFIPLTHREVGQSITFVTGHHDPDSDDCKLDWTALARMQTVVFYMAVRHFDKIANQLIEHGMDASTPVAVIENGTLPDERVTTTELALLPYTAQTLEFQAPAILIIGNVVNYRESLRRNECLAATLS